MNELKVNFENLTAEERAELLKLVEKANKPKSKVWKPENKEKYYSLCLGSVSKYCWNSNGDFGDFIDNGNYAIGNCFKTKEEAQDAIERLKIRAELQRYADEHNEPIDWKSVRQEKWSIAFDYREERFICYSYYWDRDCFQIYFTSKEIAEAALQSVGEDRIKKYLLGAE